MKWHCALCWAVLGTAVYYGRSVWLLLQLALVLSHAGAATARPSGGPTSGDGLRPGVDQWRPFLPPCTVPGKSLLSSFSPWTLRTSRHYYSSQVLLCFALWQ